MDQYCVTLNVFVKADTETAAIAVAMAPFASFGGAVAVEHVQKLPPVENFIWVGKPETGDKS